MPALGDPNIKPIAKHATMYPLKKDEALWPELFPVEWLKKTKREMGISAFSTIYQADPTAQGGGFFKSSAWFRPLPKDFDTRDGRDGKTPRERLSCYQWWDFNFSTKDTSDFTVGLTLGRDSKRNMYVLGVRRGHFTDTLNAHDTDGIIFNMIQEIEMRQPHLVGMEEAAFRQKICQAIWEEVCRHVSVPVLKPKMSVDVKELRALLAVGVAEGGQLFVDLDAPWADTFVSECLGFNKALYDDQVDALSGAVSLAAANSNYHEERASERQRWSGAVAKSQVGWR